LILYPQYEFQGCSGGREFSFRLQVSGVVFNIANLSEAFLRALPGLRLLPDAVALFVLLSVIFVRLTSEEAARYSRTVLVHSSNRIPSG
jgi:hypothetical protein